MSNPTASETPAPGWYPDASGVQRWWDGTAWTEHTAPGAASASQQQERTPLPEGTRVDGGWVWLVSLGFLLSCLPLLFFDMSGYIRAIMMAELSGDSSMIGDVLVGYMAFGIVSWLLGLVVWALAVVGAYFDMKHLVRLGVVRPFHWAYAFIPYPLVYLIGRHVVLRKVVRTAGWPLWVHIAANVVVMIFAFVWALVMVQATFAEIAYFRFN